MKVLISICARGGSKGIPLKNIKLLNDIPLINYTLKVAFKLKGEYDFDIGFSSDNQAIINEAKKFGLETNYLRPKYLAKDNTGKVETIKHLLNYQENIKKTYYDFILDLDVSSPLRNVHDIMEGFEIIKKDKKMLTLFSVSNPNRNPYFNVVEQNSKTGYFELVKKTSKTFKSRQKAPKVYDMNASFYWYKRDFFNSMENSPLTIRTGIYLMNHICFDLDNEIDFLIMELLIKNKKLDFQF